MHLNITVDDREAFDVMVAIKVMRVLNQGHDNQEEYDASLKRKMVIKVITVIMLARKAIWF